MEVDAAAGDEAALDYVVYGGAGEEGFAGAGVAWYPYTPLLLYKQPPYQFLSQILKPDKTRILRWFVP